MPPDSENRGEIGLPAHVPRQNPNRAEKRGSAYLTFALSVIFVGLGSLFIASGIGEVQRGLQRSRLPHANGVVTGCIATTQAQATQAETIPFVRIEYQYVVNGNSYNDYLMHFGIADSEARKLVKQYPSDKPVIVAYWPSSPENSYLYPSNTLGFSDYKDLIFGVFILIYSLIMGANSFGALRSTRRVSLQ